MDPVTVLAGAKAAFETVKVAIKVGKELHSVASEISKLLGAHADLTKMAASPRSGWLSKKSPEQIALDAFLAAKEAEEMTAKVRNMVTAQYGLHGWEQLHRLVIQYRKDQKAAQAAAAKRRREIIEAIMLWGSIIILSSFVFGFLFIVAIVILK
jgi:hypothetical protein